MARPALGRHRDGREPAQDRRRCSREAAGDTARAPARSTIRSRAAPTSRSSIPPCRSARAAASSPSAATCGRWRPAAAARRGAAIDGAGIFAALRHAETRYRLLFQLASEAVIIVDAATTKVDGRQPGRRPTARLGRAAAGRPPARRDVRARGRRGGRGLLAVVRAAGRADDVQVRARRQRRPRAPGLARRCSGRTSSSHFLVRLGASRRGVGRDHRAAHEVARC